MKLAPTPSPRTQDVTPGLIQAEIYDWLHERAPLQDPAALQGTSQNLQTAVAAIVRGGNRTWTDSKIYSEVPASAAASRLYRAAALICEIANRLEE